MGANNRMEDGFGRPWKTISTDDEVWAMNDFIYEQFFAYASALASDPCWDAW